MPAVTEKPRPRVSSEAFDRIFADLEQAVDVESDRLKSMTEAAISGGGPWSRNGSDAACIASTAIDIASFVIKSIVWFEASLAVARVPQDDRRMVIGSMNETAEILLSRGDTFSANCLHRQRNTGGRDQSRDLAYRQTVFDIVHASDGTVKAYLKLCGVKWSMTER